MEKYLNDDCISVVDTYTKDHSFEDIRLEMIENLYYVNHIDRIEISLYDIHFEIRNFNGWDGFSDEELLWDLCMNTNHKIDNHNLTEYFNNYFSDGDNPARTIEMYEAMGHIYNNMFDIISSEYDIFTNQDFRNLINYISNQD